MLQLFSFSRARRPMSALATKLSVNRWLCQRHCLHFFPTRKIRGSFKLPVSPMSPVHRIFCFSLFLFIEGEAAALLCLLSALFQCVLLAVWLWAGWNISPHASSMCSLFNSSVYVSVFLLFLNSTRLLCFCFANILPWILKRLLLSPFTTWVLFVLFWRTFLSLILPFYSPD